MALPSGISKTQIQRLVKRIAAEQGQLDPADQDLLRLFLGHYGSVLEVVHGTVEALVERYGKRRGLALQATSRLKTPKPSERRSGGITRAWRGWRMWRESVWSTRADR